MEKYKTFIDEAIKLGAADAKMIKADSVVASPWVRWKCRYGCGMYNTSLCCPPHSPTYLETRELLRGYEKALLIHYHKGFRSQTHPTRIAAALERDLFLAGYYRAFAFGEGPCMLCEECTFDRCAHSTEARPSMEACGIDVYGTVRNNGFPVEVLTDRSEIPNRYGMVLIE